MTLGVTELEPAGLWAPVISQTIAPLCTRSRRRARILMKIASSGPEVENAIAEHGDDIDAEMLEMLERRLERARDDAAERASVEGLTALLQRQGLQGVWAPIFYCISVPPSNHAVGYANAWHTCSNAKAPPTSTTQHRGQLSPHKIQCGRLRAEYERRHASPALRLLDEVMRLLTPDAVEEESEQVSQEARVGRARARLNSAFEARAPGEDLLSLARRLAKGEGVDA